MKKRTKQGIAKVEYIARKDKIDEMIRQGYNYKTIYDFLVEKTEMTMSYRTFVYHINPRKKKKENTHVIATPVQTQNPVTQQVKQVVQQKPQQQVTTETNVNDGTVVVGREEQRKRTRKSLDDLI